MTALFKRLHFSFGKKLPIVLQTEVAECGLACITMIANYYGYQTDLLTLRRQFSISLKGSRLQDLIDLAKKLRLLSRAVKLELQDLKYLKTPCVLHWDLDHFVVLKKVRGKKVIIHDPAVGVIKYTLSEVSDHFTGVALELSPAVDFEKKKDKTQLYLSDLWSSIDGLKLPLTQILLISLALEVFAIISPLFMQFVIDGVLVARDTPLLYVLAIGFALLTLITTITSYVRSWIIMFLSNVLNIQLVANLARHLFKLSLEFFEKRHMGDILSRFGSMGSIQEKISTEFVAGIVDGIMVIATLVMMLIYNWLLTGIVFIALTLYTIIRIALFSTMKRQQQENLVLSAKENSVFMESIRAILPLKIFGKEAQRENMWQNCYADKLNSGIRLAKLGLLYSFLNQIIFGMEYIVIVLLGALSIMDNKFSIGMLTAYLAYRQQFVGKAQGMIDKVIEYKMISLHLDRVADIALTEPEKEQEEGERQHEITGHIKVENLAFRYSEQDPFIFQNLNFEINAGESVAIIGQSGCGKTTLVKNLMYLLLPTSGNILFDNINMKQLGLHAYRSQIAAVMQEDTLLSGSISDNISFFDPKPNFDRVYACAMLAAIHDDIIQMPMAYQSLVGDMGTTLSGGQKQRILVARALYSQPKILFLDEATSHLDTSNESIVNQHIQKIGITRIIIAHRQETVTMADRVINLEEIIMKEKMGRAGQTE